MSSSVEVDTSKILCHGCLSFERKTFAIKDYSEIFYRLMTSDSPYFNYGFSSIKFCWECIAMLKRITNFRSQVQRAQNKVMLMIYSSTSGKNEKCLSKLAVTTKNQYDFQYNTEVSIDIEMLQKNGLTLNFGNNITIKKIEKEFTKSQVDGCDKIPILRLTPVKLEDIKKEVTDDEEIDNYNDTIDNSYDDDFPMDNIEYKQEIQHGGQKGGRPRKMRLADDKNKKIKDKKENSKIHKRELCSLAIDFKLLNHFDKVFLTEQEIAEFVLKNTRTQPLKKRIDCTQCDRIFHNMTEFKRHVDLSHNSTPPFKCSLCDLRLPTKDKLEEHWRVVHQRYFKCKTCGEIVSRNSAKKHYMFYHRFKYHCTKCRYVSQSVKESKIHFKDYHTKYTCDSCKATYTIKNKLIRHIYKYHTEDKCDICNAKFKSGRYKDKHIADNHPELLNINVNKELSYCVECDIQYPSVQKYKCHLKGSKKHTVIKKKSYPCPECNKVFVKSIYMKNHYNLIHMKKTKHYCKECNKYYANNYGLKKHNESIHLKLPKVKNKFCDLCGRGFSSNGILIKHRRTHTGERPFQCSFCPAAFAQQSAMYTHEKKQHVSKNNQINNLLGI